MNIGFISAWCEQGAAYVTKQYIELLKDTHNIYVYARGNAGGRYDANWDQEYVTWGRRTFGTMNIDWYDFAKWIKRNKIELLFFNEQQNMEILAKVKKKMPKLIIGAYIDYYKRNTISKHIVYDFLICNTKRHYETFKWHPQCYYVPWGTNTSLYCYDSKLHMEHGMITFFHSMGNSDRKGTLALIDTFVNTDLYMKSKLIIHTQLDEDWFKKNNVKEDEIRDRNVQIIHKTVSAPGLYYLGDIYVYPAELDGVGLTIYEALSSGLPVIGTDVPPINEPLNEINGRKIQVKKYIAREDGYYWPLSIIDEKSLYKQMKYYIDNSRKICEIKEKVRMDAVRNLEWEDRKQEVQDIFAKVQLLQQPSEELLKSLLPDKSIGRRIDEFIGLVYGKLERYKN